jgi:hypothetical protein
MSHFLTRRRFVLSAVVGTVGAAGYGLVRAVQKVRDAARQLSDV